MNNLSTGLHGENSLFGLIFMFLIINKVAAVLHKKPESINAKLKFPSCAHTNTTAHISHRIKHAPGRNRIPLKSVVSPPLMTDWPQCGTFPPQPKPTSAFNYSNHASEKTQSNAPPAIRVWPIFARPIAYHQGARQPGRFCRSVASRGQDAVKV